MVLISCCNVQGGLYVLDENDYSYERIFDYECRGITHNVETNNFFACSHMTKKLYKFDDKFNIEKSVPITHDIHGMVCHLNKIYLVNTFYDKIDIYDTELNYLDSYDFSTNIMLYDEFHINDMFIDNDNLMYLSMFRDKPDDEYTTLPVNGKIKCRTLNNKSKSLGSTLVKDLVQPHSPKIVDNKLFICNSRRSELHVYDKTTLELIQNIKLDGFTRGLTFSKDLDRIYVGCSASINRRSNNDFVNDCKIHVLDFNTYERLSDIILPSTEVYALVNY